MSLIERQDLNGVKPLLQTGEFGYDNYPAGGDSGRVYVGTGSVNIPLAKKAEISAVDEKADVHIARVDNPHGVTKAQVGLGNADNTSDNVKNVLSAIKWTTARTITLSGDVSGSASVDGSANVTITTAVQPNSVALGTDTTGNYMADIIAGSGISVSHTPSEGSTATITNSAPNVTTNITTTHNSANVIVNSSDGTDGTINSATQTLAGVMSATDKTKLDGIEVGATADQTGAEIKALYESNANTNALTDSLLTLLTTKKVKNVSTDALNDKLVITYTDDTVSNLNINDIITDIHVSGATLDATTNVLTLTSTDGGADVIVDLSDFVNSSELTTALNTAVKLTGNQTIAGVKTFTSSPIVPTPTTDFQVSTKKYVDDEVTGANNYTDTRVNDVVSQLSTDYYQGAYGISWDYATDTYIRTGAKGFTAIQSLMRRCVLNADGTVNYYLNPNNSNFKEDGTPSVLTGADGNVMVEIPKHYIKVETVGNIDSLSVSLTPETGYVLDPAFLKWNGTAMVEVEVPYRYFRAYEGFVSGGKLLSVSGVTPTTTQTIATFRTQAMANGDGWHLTDWNLLNTIKRLCYIEFCDFIVTKYLGEGNHTGSDYGITTGQSNALGNRSSNSTHNDKYMSYRGIENMYADIWEFVDGVNINNYQFYVNGKYSTFASDVFTGDYVAKGPLTVAGASNSLIKRCAVSVDGGFIPTVIGGSTTTFYGDALWSATGARIAIYGGDAGSGASDGPSPLSVNNASSLSDTNIGAAVCR